MLFLPLTFGKSSQLAVTTTVWDTGLQLRAGPREQRPDDPYRWAADGSVLGWGGVQF